MQVTEHEPLAAIPLRPDQAQCLKPATKPTRFLIELESLETDRAALIRRVRSLLKQMGRGFGFRCVRVEPAEFSEGGQ